MDAAQELAEKVCADLDELTHIDQAAIEDVIERHAPEPSLTSPPAFHGWIDSVEIQGIRAFGTNQVVNLSRGLTILYAENGSGKTSFVDAMELLSNGSTTRSRQFPGVETEVKDQQHIPHAGTDGKSVGPPPRVIAHWYPGPDVPVEHTAWEAMWERSAQNPPPVNLIARRRLREIINAKGADRAERLGESLGLGNLTATWLAAQKCLGAAATTLTTDEWLDPRLANTIEACELDDTIAEARTLDDLIVAIKHSARDVLHRSEADRDLSKPDHAPAGHNIEVTITGPPVPPVSTALHTLADKLQRQGAEATTGIDRPLVTLLEAFRQIAAVDTLCPACESGHVTAPRLASIDEVLAAAAAHTSRLREHNALRDRLEAELRRISSADLSWTPPLSNQDNQTPGIEEAFATATQSVDELATEWTAEVRSLEARLNEAETSLTAATAQSAVEVLTSLEVLHGRAREVVTQADELRRALREKRLAAQALDPERLQATHQLDHAEQIATNILSRRRNTERANAYKSAARALKQKLDSLIEKRFQELAAPINEWLIRLAPEQTPRVRVTTKRTAGRTTLQIHVEGGKVTAIGRLSDSQLDMLGLAAHLATLEREAAGQPVFIDDPTDMLDHATREKLANEGINHLLGHAGDGPRRQVVLLTHDDQLVRSLWDHHGRNLPCTMQAVIELDRTTKVPEAIITPRSPDQYLSRVDTLLTEHANERSRIWLRNAAGNLTRQALELIVKDMLVVVGPRGHRYLNAEVQPTDDTRGVGTAFNDLVKVLNRVAELQRQCGLPQHRSALQLIAKLVDVTERRKDYLLDDASHPTFVFPSASQIKIYAKSLRELAGKLKTSGLHDEWPTTCNWYSELKLCDNCPTYTED